MATHDYVIANGTGAAVRSDLNNALAAIVSNNSGSSEPGTTYAYQWWADTNANVLKIRNSANNAWITLRELDGTMLIEDGSASTPGLAFADDVNTGIFSPAADQIGFATGGAERLEIGSSEVVFNDPSNDVDFRVESNGQTHMLFVDGGNDRIGVATTTPVEMLQVAGSVCGTSSSAGFTAGPARSFLDYDSSSSIGRFGVSSGADTSAESLAFYISADSSTGCSEAARIDSNGRLKVGGTGDPSNKNTITPKVLVDGSGVNGALQINRFTAPGGGGAQLLLSATRGSSAASYTVVQNGDGLGTIDFCGADGGEFVSAASIQAAVDGAPGDDDVPGLLKFSTTADGASSPSERMRISSSGNVGIGETAPANLLHVKESDTGVSPHASAQIVLERSGTNYLQFLTANDGTQGVLFGDSDDNDRGKIVYVHSANDHMAFEVAAGERMRISDVGDLRIGHTNNLGNGKLEVHFDASRNGIHLRPTTATLNQNFLIFTNSAGSTTGKIEQNGTTSTNYATSSDYRLKENIVDLDGAIARVKQLAPKRFNFIGEADRTVDGFLAHEAQTVVPEAITGTHNGVEVWKEGQELPEGVSVGDNKLDEDGNTIPDYQGIDQSRLVPLLTAALQEAITKIEILETKVAALEAS
jgi:hypothetical protein|tara:strand:- start:625 stop:2553 length:1929 start_codon:yes stop_codon:yes gene_type:complete